jgi:hypothetical protein
MSNWRKRLMVDRPHPVIWGGWAFVAACGLVAKLFDHHEPQTTFGIIWAYVSSLGFVVMFAWGVAWAIRDVVRLRRQANG